MDGSIRVAVDAMGGDNAPDVVLEGVDAALSESSIEILLCGSPEVVQPFCAERERCTPVCAREVISMGEHPANAVRKKKDSSIVVGCSLVRDGKADGFFSAGSTGACLVAATMVIGRVKGIKRPALTVLLPTYKKPTLLLDVGANADCKPEFLVQFAQMGAIYSQNVLGVQSPSVALLNIGEEPTKGSTFAQDVYAQLQALPNFAGNCEGTSLLAGDFDVVVTDGFTGNVTLKTIEGTGKTLFKYVKDALGASLKTKLGAALIAKELREVKDKTNADTVGGSPLLGIKGACIVGHGASSAEAIKNGIFTTSQIAQAKVPEQIKSAIVDAEANTAAAS